MYDKLVYSLIWLAGLLYALSWAAKHELHGWWLAGYCVLFVAVLIQLVLVLYHGSDAYSRHRMWQKMRGKP